MVIRSTETYRLLLAVVVLKFKFIYFLPNKVIDLLQQLEGEIISKHNFQLAAISYH